jgi:hypothetical protein
MKHLLLLFLFIFSINISISQTQWWAEQVSGVTTALTSVSVSNCSNGVWACGYSGVVLKGGGSNWVNISGNGIPSNVQLINICGLDCTTALVAGYLGTNTWVWKTTNSGANWTQVFTQPNGFIDGIRYRGYNIGRLIMVGDPVGGRWSIWRSTNLGSTWDSSGMYLPQAGSESGYNNSLCWNGMFGSGDSSVWFGTNNSRIYRSVNNGMNWFAQLTGAELNSYSVVSMGPDVLVGGATLLRSTDLGSNWSTVTAPGSGNFGGFIIFYAPVDNNNSFGSSWFIRSDNKIYVGGNGTNWSIQYTAPAGNYRHIATLDHGGPIWAVRDNGGISACLGCNVSGITPLSSETPTQFTLGQNYPNPFNPTTAFEFSVAARSHVKICVYSSIGQMADIINDGFLNAGTYGVNWNGAKFSSGVYYYSLFARDESSSKVFAQTKKMILIK